MFLADSDDSAPPPLPPHGITSSSINVEYRPPVPPHRNIGVTANMSGPQQGVHRVSKDHFSCSYRPTVQSMTSVSIEIKKLCLMKFSSIALLADDAMSETEEKSRRTAHNVAVPIVHVHLLQIISRHLETSFSSELTFN